MTPRSMERRKKSKMSNPHQIAFFGKGPSAKPRPTKKARRPRRRLRRKILMFGGDSKAHYTRLILNSKAQDNVLHLAARCA
ncbi:hypothetical protein [Sinorhizobium terangae]|uniref:hypothetical protein n=1 Tax=Sinorhizobium terangae TaxID=110322 RepID=UPI003D15FAF7